jgi:hypothetical protein
VADEITPRPGDYPPNIIFRAKEGGALVVQHNNVERTLPVGTLLVPDYGRREVGLLRWKPFNDEGMRIALNGEMPPEDDEGDYLPALRWPILVHGVGKARMTTTSRAFIAAARRWFDTFIAAPEAADGLLCVYRADQSSGYEPKKALVAGTLYAPVWRSTAWMQRDPSIFGKRLIAVPKALPAATEPAVVPTDVLFDNLAISGELMLPLPAPRTPAARRITAELLPAGDDLNDEIPF